MAKQKTDADPVEALERLIQSATYLLPSLEAGSRDYDHVRYWRGPIWLVVSYMAARGLDEAGQKDWAEHLQKEGHLPNNSRLPERVRKRLAWQAFAEFTYLSRRGRNLAAHEQTKGRLGNGGERRRKRGLRGVEPRTDRDAFAHRHNEAIGPAERAVEKTGVVGDVVH